MKKHGLFVVVLASLSFSTLSYARDTVPGEYIVKIKSEATASTLAVSLKSSLLTKLGKKALKEYSPFVTSQQLALVKLDPSLDEDKALALIASNPFVEYVEPNGVYHLNNEGAPNDADFVKLWGLKNTGQTVGSQVGTPGSDINVLPVWARGITGSRRVSVAVIDTGIDYKHPDLVDNILLNAGEIPGDSIDNDQNGFVDDVYGWDFINRDNDPMDGHSHGTHCAGTIGAKGNNALGVAGVNWDVSLLPVKIFSDSGSTTSAAIVEAINYATSRKVNVMSNSWGGGPFSQALLDAIKATRDAGILFVAAAGNSGSDNDARAYYPSGYDVDNIVAVAATDNKDQRASFSSYGKTKVHVAAPGVNVHSTIPNGGYGNKSGTSMATPHVAGIAALLLSANPNMTYAEVKARMIATSTKVEALAGRVVANGRVNVLRAIDNITD